jgi:hypothetical protein
MRQTIMRFERQLLFLAAMLSCALAATNASAATIFESGTLGPTGVPYSQLGNTVPGTNINQFVFPGVRFQITQRAVTSAVGGHFVEETGGTFFGAIVALEDENDFPDSNDLSSPDVLGTTTLTFPNPSAEVFGDLELELDPGWYALVFGSGLFETNGSGGAVRNGMDIDDPSYIAFDPNLGWFNLDIFQTFFDNHRFVVRGTFVPEPNTLSTILLLPIVFWSLRRR